jgi:hypothetical protein
MSLQNNPNMYMSQYDFITDTKDLKFVTNNKLFATFTPLSEIDTLVSSIRGKYSIMYNKIFVLHVKQNDEYVCTYNVDQGNLNDILENTILVHRKKETNTLYSINALNELIKKLNGGLEDSNYKVDWANYRNSILLTQHNELKELKTKIFRIINLED